MDNLPFIFLSVSIYHILQKRIGQFSGRISQSSTHLFAVQPVFPEFHMCTCTIIYINYEGVRIYQGIRMIKRSEMRPLGDATFCDNLLLAVTTILTPTYFSLSEAQYLVYQEVPLSATITCVRALLQERLPRFSPLF